MLFIAALVIAAAVLAVARRADVRLVLPLAGLALGILGGDTAGVVRTFLATLSKEQFVVPLCTAMGFARVLRHTGCDRHLVLLLASPIRRVRPLLVPGAVIVGFLINVPIISQAGTVVTVGPVLLPLLRAAGVSPVTAGAALLLGTSIGGELLNPGAPELQSVSVAVRERRQDDTPAKDVAHQAGRLLLVHLSVAVLLFWLISAWADRSRQAAPWPEDPDAVLDGDARVNLVKAVVPLIPVVLLVLAGPPWYAMREVLDRLAGAGEGVGIRSESRLIGLAMLLGSVAAALTAGRVGASSARAFFEGAGYSYANVVGVIVAATTFGQGVQAVHLPELMDETVRQWPGLLVPLAAALPFFFALVCGSGMASTQSVFPFFVSPALGQGIDPVALGALVSVAAAAGRTVSPVAAVTLLCSGMTGAPPLALVRRLVIPILAGLAITLLVRTLLLSS
jgi:DcuC family C4-dicarboxylate transporter